MDAPKYFIRYQSIVQRSIPFLYLIIAEYDLLALSNLNVKSPFYFCYSPSDISNLEQVAITPGSWYAPIES